MKHRFFSVYDAKTEAYLPTFLLQTDAQAIRAFMDCVKDPNHQFGAHPEDYTLFVFGEWDDYDGTFDILPTGKALVKGNQRGPHIVIKKEA